MPSFLDRPGPGRGYHQGGCAPFLSVSPNGRYLLAGGRPFLMHGYVAWSALTNLNRADFATFADNMQSKGVTALIANAIEALWTPGTLGGANPPPGNFNGDLPFTGTVSGHPDFTTPNPAYWAEIDWKINALMARNIYALQTPAYGGFAGSSPPEGFLENGDLAANGSTRLTDYGKFLGARYRTAPNIVWMHYADVLPDATGRALVKALSDGLRLTDYGGRLHTNHYTRPSLSTDDATVACDINFAYSRGGPAGSPFVHKKILDGYAVSPVLPVFLGEGEYDHRASGTLSTQQLRSNSWEAWLSGGCGHFFGDEYTWSFNSPQGTSELYTNHLADTGITEYAHVRTFLQNREWWKLAPSQGTGLVTSGGGTVDTSGYKPRALASDGSWGAVYCTDGTTATVNLALFSGTVTARYFDPSNGAYYAVTGGPTFANSGTHTFVASSEHGNNAAGGSDLVLALETVPA